MTRIEAIRLEAPTGSLWYPKNRPNDQWKVIGHYPCDQRDSALVEIAKYQGGRNSPAYVHLGVLKRNFAQRTQTPELDI